MATPSTREFIQLKRPTGPSASPATVGILSNHVGELQLLLQRMQQDIDETAGRRGESDEAFDLPVRLVTSAYRLTDADFCIIASSATSSFPLYLPAAGGTVQGRLYAVKRTGSQNVVITPNGAEKIDGAASYTLNAINQGVILQSNGADWQILSETSKPNPSEVPVGGIIFYHGVMGGWPSNYALCDGTAGTPDMRGLLPIGAGGAYAIGDTGGAVSINLAHTHTADGTLATDAAPAHLHGAGTYSAVSNGDHLHSADGSLATDTNAATPSATVEVAAGAGTVVATSGHTHSHTHDVTGSTSTTGAHTHVITNTSDTGGVHSHDVQGNTASALSSPTSILPPFLALAFIKRIS